MTLAPRRTSLRANVIANYVGQAYSVLIGIVLVPAYLHYLGPEAYGLIGVFTLMQSWLQLLDFGLSATLMRETARFRAGAIDSVMLLELLHRLEGLFVMVALIVAGSIAFGSETLATRWLELKTLPIREVGIALALMGGSVALRLIGGLYRGIINGFERQVWLNGFVISSATLRFGGVLLVLVFIEASPGAFFTYQIAVAAFELLVLMIKSYRLLPARPDDTESTNISRSSPGLLRFAATIAFTSTVFVLVSQTDKLLLSRWLPLDQYGYLTLALTAAGGIGMIGAPIGQALLPRLTALVAETAVPKALLLYRRSSAIACLLAAPVSLSLACFAEPFLWAWTGDHTAAVAGADTLTLYSLGNAILVPAAFAYYLQYAFGELRLHFWGSALFLALLMPLLVHLVPQYGARGAGWSWLMTCSAYFAFWVPLVHRRFAPGLHLRWLVRDVSAFFAWALLGAFALRPLVDLAGTDRIMLLIVIIGGTGLQIGISGAALRAIWRRTAAEPATSSHRT
ncbi:MAG: oligosaccharide flippase family protein [Methylotetracoccus sp.]